MRDDLMYTAYAVSKGFKIAQHNREPNFIKGIPHDALEFKLGNVLVWQTARGWRVAALDPETNVYPTPQDADFHAKLLPALDKALDLAAAAPTSEPENLTATFIVVRRHGTEQHLVAKIWRDDTAPFGQVDLGDPMCHASHMASIAVAADFGTDYRKQQKRARIRKAMGFAYP